MGFRVAPILPNNLDGRKRVAIQESDAANHGIRKEMVGPNGLIDRVVSVNLVTPTIPLLRFLLNFGCGTAVPRYFRERSHLHVTHAVSDCLFLLDYRRATTLVIGRQRRTNCRQFLASIRDSSNTLSLEVSDDMKLHRFGDTVVVTGATHEKGKQRGKIYEHYGRFTDTWISSDGQWRCVASHTNLVRKAGAR